MATNLRGSTDMNGERSRGAKRRFAALTHAVKSTRLNSYITDLIGYIPGFGKTNPFLIDAAPPSPGDLDGLRGDPAFKLACGRLPDSGRDLCSRPTMSQLENAPE
jgi:hypothetical protein